MTRLLDLIIASQNGDESAKEKLIQENAGLIWAIVQRYTGRGVEIDDLYQIGCLGFLKAVDGFDVAYGTQFSTYAVPKISGEIRRFLRDDGAVKVSRSMKEQAGQIKAARSCLYQIMGKEPTVLEISRQTGLTPEQIAMAESAVSCVESIHQPVGDGDYTLENIISDSDGEENFLEKVVLRQAIRKLPEREAKVISLRYFHALTQQRIASILNISQVQVSRIEKRAIERLREMLA